jgi:hypothetical protein
MQAENVEMDVCEQPSLIAVIIKLLSGLVESVLRVMFLLRSHC